MLREDERSPSSEVPVLMYAEFVRTLREAC
jgi:hypothetical protein